MVSRDRLGWIVAGVVMLGAVFMWRESGSARGGAMNEMAVACDPTQQAVVSRQSSTAQVVVRCVPADGAIATMAIANGSEWAAPRSARAVPAGYTIAEVPQVATVQSAPRVIEPARTSAPVRRASNGRSWQKRVAIIREIDGILASEHHYILGWQAPFQRIAYWNKFGHPEGYLSRIGDYHDMTAFWWVDPQKDQQLTQALKGATPNLAVGPTEIRYWPDFVKKSPQPAAPRAAGN